MPSSQLSVVTAVPVGAAAVVPAMVPASVPATAVIVAATVIITSAAVVAAAVKSRRHNDPAGAPRHAASVDVTVKSGSASARSQRYA